MATLRELRTQQVANRDAYWALNRTVPSDLETLGKLEAENADLTRRIAAAEAKVAAKVAELRVQHEDTDEGSL